MTQTREASFVLLAALLVLCIHIPVCKPDRLHIEQLNDQVGYITTARWLADTGELRSQLIYPTFIKDFDKENWRPYMPGHYWALAASYLLFGDGPLQWRLPNLVSFLVISVCVFLSGRLLYGATAGFVAAFLFMVFSANVYYAFTAMSDPTFIAVSMLAFTIFLHLKRPLLWMPLLLAPPFLFRELAALLVIPMLLVRWSRAHAKRVAPFLVSTLCSAAVLWLLNAWQIAAGKQSPAHPFVWLRAGINYNDPVLDASIPPFGGSEYLLATLANLGRNLELLSIRLSWSVGRSWELSVEQVQLVLILISLAWGISRRRSDLFPLGAGLLGAAVFTLMMLFHVSYGSVVFRHLLFTVPFSAIATASAAISVAAPWAARLRARGRGGIVRLAGIAAVLLALGIGHVGVVAMAKDLTTETEPIATQLLERLDIDPDKLLVSPPWIALDYVQKHYPVRWCFVPANEESLRLVAAHYEIGTLIVPKASVGRVYSREGLRELHLYPAGRFARRFVVFESRP